MLYTQQATLLMNLQKPNINKITFTQQKKQNITLSKGNILLTSI